MDITMDYSLGGVECCLKHCVRNVIENMMGTVETPKMRRSTHGGSGTPTFTDRDSGI